MPFALLHGESLVAVAAWALGEAEAELLDFDTSWPAVQGREALLVVHDPLCPATPVAFLREAIQTAAAKQSVVVGVRPVTDTVKTMADDLVGGTVDREDLVAVASPLVSPPGVVALAGGVALARRPVGAGVRAARTFPGASWRHRRWAVG